MFNKRTRSKPSNRARPPSDNEDAEPSLADTSATETGGESPLSAVKKLKEKTKKSKTKSKLSFGAEEEEVRVFLVVSHSTYNESRKAAEKCSKSKSLSSVAS